MSLHINEKSPNIAEKSPNIAEKSLNINITEKSLKIVQKLFVFKTLKRAKKITLERFIWMSGNFQLCLVATQILGLNNEFWPSNVFFKWYSKKHKKHFKTQVYVVFFERFRVRDKVALRPLNLFLFNVLRGILICDQIIKIPILKF